MKRETTMLTTFALVLALALPCWAQVRELPTQTTTISGTIETIDKNKRAMNIKTADGSFVAVNVPETVQRFGELKVGDKVKATYNNNVMVRLKPPGEHTQAMSRLSAQKVRERVYGQRKVAIRFRSSPASTAGKSPPEQLLPCRRVFALHQILDTAGRSKDVPRA